MSARRCTAVLRVLLTGAAVACGRPGSEARSAPTAEYVPMAGAANLPFSALVRVGPMLYLSGQLGTDSTGRLVRGGIGPETAQALANIRALLEANGSGMDRVVKCTAMLADMAEWGAMNQEYVRASPPAIGRREAPSAPPGWRWAHGWSSSALALAGRG